MGNVGRQSSWVKWVVVKWSSKQSFQAANRRIYNIPVCVLRRPLVFGRHRSATEGVLWSANSDAEELVANRRLLVEG